MINLLKATILWSTYLHKATILWTTYCDIHKATILWSTYLHKATIFIKYQLTFKSNAYSDITEQLTYIKHKATILWILLNNQSTYLKLTYIQQLYCDQLTIHKKQLYCEQPTEIKQLYCDQLTYIKQRYSD